jgi:nucleotide-binding universal stress UspA family protein
LVLVLLGWLFVGAMAALIMRRRGHDAFVWMVMFVVLGPLALPLAISAERHPTVGPDTPVRPAAFDVVVAFDGSARAHAALATAAGLFGDSMTSLTLVTVLDAEAQTSQRGIADEASAREELSAASRSLDGLLQVPVDSVVLYGAPAHAIADFARTHGYELIIAGTRGRGASRAVLGSVAEQLAKRTLVPVLLCPDHDEHN